MSSGTHDQMKSDAGLFDDGLIELPNQHHRENVLRLLLIISAVFGLFFSILNWVNNAQLAIAEVILAIYSLLLLPFVRNDKRLFTLSLLFLVPLYSTFLFALTLPTSSETVYVWILVVPVLSHLLLGRWFGLALSIIFILTGLSFFVMRFQDNGAIFNLAATSNVMLAGLATLVFSHVYEVNRIRAHRQLLHLATTDSLTSLANRTRFLDVFERERNHAVRNHTDLSLLLLDIDHFKRVNDSYGHDVGDEVLKHISATIKDRLRKTDLACRLGGEEFAVLLPGASLARAVSIAEAIRKNIADVPYVKQGKLIAISVSIGVAEYGVDGPDLESLYGVADRNLYRAKTAGRNRIRSREVMKNGELDLALADCD